MGEGKSTDRTWWSRPRPAQPDPAPATSDSGDFTLAKPAPAPGTASEAGTPEAGAEGRGADGGGVAVPSPETPASGETPAAPSKTPAGDPGAERPRPLHDPDPYGTPPYGEPGPWALAPPVQHPRATPPHGTTTSGATANAAPESPAAPQAPAPQAPAPQAPAPPAVPSPAPAHYAPPSLDKPQPSPPGAPAPTMGAAAPHQPAPDHAPAQGPYPGGGGDEVWGRYDPWAVRPLQQTGGEQAGARRSRRGAVVGVVLVALIAGVLGGVVGAAVEREGSVTDVHLPQAGPESAQRAPDSVAGIAAAALPSVVTLHVRGAQEQGTGTGFVLDGKGHILTNNHVVEPASDGGEITVTFSGGQSAKARVVGRDTGYDLAVVKVSGVTGLKPLALGNSDNVQVGDPVVAIGAPFDLANTVTSGIISAKERPITAGGGDGGGSDISYVDALQTDAPINPGNSGGPLVDAKARVIGINSAIRSADGGQDTEGGQSGSIGLGFAIPINQAKRVAEELINDGFATHPVLGVTLDMDYTGDGARVAARGNSGGSAVERGGPGAKAGIRDGDVISRVDGKAVHSGEELIVRIRSHRPGDRLELTLHRAGKEKKVSLVLGAAKGN
ncbi:trypsin-like peptidase domain-containing protein [Streptomyces sp. NPDC058045]|uniref:trypsin-like peptidase domain-containing protein n=1 Tax=Streptomyces sp. NPDC058045 TaxID=3346311 RepID=UPI0036E93A7F